MKKKPLVLHPFLIAMLPILIMYVHNMVEVDIVEIYMPLLIVTVCSSILWLMLTWILHNRIKAALLTSLFFIWFLSFGHLATLATPALQAHFHHATRIFSLVYLMLLIAAVVALFLLRRGLQTINSMLNFIAVGLVIWNVLNIAVDEIQVAVACRKAQATVSTASMKLRRPQNPPNIYYIILDGYARADVLKERYDLDNRDFLNYLRQKGFYVAEKSKANYCQTLLSLASSLNLDYLDNMVGQIGPDFESRKPLIKMLQRNLMLNLMEEQKYRTVAFASGYSGTELHRSEVFIDTATAFSSFHEFLIFATPIPVILSALHKVLSDIPQFQVYDALQMHRQRIENQFRALPDTARMEPPVFVFTHILCPHPPFLFDRNGKRTSQSENLQALDLADKGNFEESRQKFNKAYIEQLLFVNQEMERVIDQILANSKRPPIIVIQADHGPGWGLGWGASRKLDTKEAFGIFFACYLPGKSAAPPDNISPVNIFRFILNRYFEGHLDILANENYYSNWSKPYRFIRITDELEKGKKIY
jgi:hypothetical protein